MKTMDQVIKQVNNVLIERMTNKGISFRLTNLSNKHHDMLCIEPYNYLKTVGDILHGMHINYEDGIFEVIEYQAGKNTDELHIFTETKSFKVALKSLLKGNKKRKPLKIWN